MGRFHEPEYKKTQLNGGKFLPYAYLKKISFFSFFNQRKIRGRVYIFKLVNTFLSERYFRFAKQEGPERISP